jgi:PDZ domain-containing protein
MRRVFTPFRLVVLVLVLAAITFGILWFTPSGDYLLLPDAARPVAPLIHVEGGKAPRDGGGIYFVDVLIRQANLFESIWPGIYDGSELVPSSEINPPGVTQSEREQADLRVMDRSQQIAAAVALKQLGYRVTATPSGVVVNEIVAGTPSVGRLQPSDVIVAVDGQPARTPVRLRALIRRHKPGEVVRIGIRTRTGIRTVAIKTARDPEDPTRPIIGVIVAQAANIKLPLKVRFDTGDIGGPSAGLAFALGLMEQLGRDVDHGYRVAATGEIGLDGSVSPIGGVKQKVFDAKKSKVDLFLVPAGDNASEARRYAHGLRVVAVKSFRQALHVLATLPPRA